MTPEVKSIESLAEFEKKIRCGNLMTALVDSAKFPLAISVLFKTNL